MCTKINVIPAKAGIHLSFAAIQIKMDPGLQPLAEVYLERAAYASKGRGDEKIVLCKFD
jgi:hypothetical protein